MLLRTAPGNATILSSLVGEKDTELAAGNGTRAAVTTAVQTIVNSIILPTCAFNEQFRAADCIEDKEYKHFFTEACLITGILLSGPPGTGKTYSLKAIQGMKFPGCRIEVCEIKLRDLLASDDGIAELMEILATLKTVCENVDKCNKSQFVIRLVLLDEIDSLGTGPRDSEIQHLIKHYLCKYMDLMHWKAQRSNLQSKASVYIVFIATTNRPADVDEKLKTGSRLAKEIPFLGSSLNDKELILKSRLLAFFTESSSAICDSDDVFNEVIDFVLPRLGGYAAADISALVKDAYRAYVEGGRCGLLSCFQEALAKTIPSCLRSNVISVPSITYDDVIGHEEAKKCFRRALSFYEKQTGQLYKKYGLSCPGGILLYGPPGTTNLICFTAVLC